MLTETSSIPWAFLDFALWVDMLILTLVTIAALSVLGIKPALWHLLHIEYVQKFTVFALFT
jgi:hypothetical protein